MILKIFAAVLDPPPKKKEQQLTNIMKHYEKNCMYNDIQYIQWYLLVDEKNSWKILFM